MPITNPRKRGDTFIEAIKTHLFFADELVIVDGGSDDGSIEEILALRDNRIKIVVREWDQKQWSWAEFCKAWNTGLAACTGDFVAAGETDHILHENEIDRLKSEIDREAKKGKAVIRMQKLQSASWDKWQSKSQMYYFIYKSKFPQIKYGFDPQNETDLAHPIWHDERTYYEDGVPQGTAIKEETHFAGLVGGTGANLYNYLWTFKTFDMILSERLKSMKAWNLFSGFTNVYRKAMPTDPAIIREKLLGQIMSVRAKANRDLPLHQHPKIMQAKIEQELTLKMVGHPDWKPEFAS